MPTAAVRRRPPAPPAPERIDKRDALLRAAIDTFAARGFFNAQVADVARAAGVAAGTVYLYFRSKDDLLISIFERTMKEAIAEGRAELAGSTIRSSGCGRSRASTSADSAATATRGRVPGRAAPVDEVHGALLRDAAARLPRHHPRRHRRRPGARRCSAERQPDTRRQDVLRRARRDGDQLDAEPPALLARRPKPTPIVDLFVGGLGTARRRRACADPHRSAVLGAGTMGAQIAAHLANAGVPSLLLDVTRRRRARGARARARAQAGSVLHARRRGARPTGGFDDDLDALAERRLDHRGRRRAPRRQAGAARAGRRGARAARDRQLEHVRDSDRARSPRAAPTASGAHLLGTHFFNPPRYLRLLEIIPTPETDPAVVDAIAAFADHRLGKGVVVAKDTPNFIANHIGLYGVMRMLRALATGGYTIEEIDAITGPAIGRPKSATFRTIDIAGIDILAHVAANLAERLGREDAGAVHAAAVRRGTRGARLDWRQGRPGFLQEGRGGEILTLDPASMTYRAKRRAARRAGCGESIEDGGADRETVRVRDKVGAFLRDTLGATLIYTARVAPDIAHRSTTSIARCAGASAGSSGRSKRGMPSAWLPSPTPAS